VGVGVLPPRVGTKVLDERTQVSAIMLEVVEVEKV
jgi:hypothetical protein